MELLVAKFSEYAAFGVRQYWLVDPDARAIEIFELAPDGRYISSFAASGGRVRVPGCEGLILDLASLWREL
ncbi:MAG: Uma2 family endonuclease [Myxococcaceae bacterium]